MAAGGSGGGGSARADHQAAINSMMMERMSTDICALKKQYARIKRRQQQQAMQLYIRTGTGGMNNSCHSHDFIHDCRFALVRLYLTITAFSAHCFHINISRNSLVSKKSVTIVHFCFLFYILAIF